MLTRAFFVVASVVVCISAQTPPEVAAELARADQALAAHKNEDAAKAFAKADKLANGTCDTCEYGAARAFYDLGNFGKASEYCDRAIANAKSKDISAQAHSLKGSVVSAR